MGTLRYRCQPVLIIVMHATVEKNPPDPPGLTVSQQLRDLAKGDALFIETGSIGGARAIVSRIAAEFPRRKFTTSKTEKGLRVWRLR